MDWEEGGQLRGSYNSPLNISLLSVSAVVRQVPGDPCQEDRQGTLRLSVPTMPLFHFGAILTDVNPDNGTID